MLDNRLDHTGVKLKSYNFIKKIGQGAWADVYECFDEKTKNLVACKVIQKKQIGRIPKLRQLVQTQILVLQKCKNQNVISYVDSLKTDKQIFIFTQFCNGGDMELYVEKKKTLQEDEAIVFLKQILNGFKGLHEVNAMHRDFKSANILLHNGVAKIADLGFSKILSLSSDTRTILGTSLTMAPELLQNKSYGYKCDIWSIGVVYYQFLFGDYPYDGINDYEILKKIKKQRPKFDQSINISENSKNFINSCLTIDVQKRIDWIQIYKHPLFIDKANNYRNTTLGGLVSKINLTGNKDFYEQNNKKLIQGKNNLLEKSALVIDGLQLTQIQQTKFMQQIRLEFQKKKQKENAILNMVELYLSRRNYIMLIFKHGINPIFNDFTQIPFNQNVYAFLMTKKCYFDMIDFQKSIQQKKNIFAKTKYWNQFLKSNQYKSLRQKISQDLNTIKLYSLSFLKQINNAKQNFKNQLNLNSRGPNFISILNQQLTEFTFKLYDQKDNKLFKKKTILKLIVFCTDLIKKIPMKAEQYDEMIENLDFKLVEKQFKSKVEKSIS